MASDTPAEPVPVRVQWLAPAGAAPDVVPPGKRFTAVSKFAEDHADWSLGGWTVVMEFDPPPAQQGNPSQGRAHFLRTEAPHDRLRRGTAFDLFALKKHVARVEVVG